MHLYFGKIIKTDVSFGDLKRQIRQGFNPSTIMTYSMDQLEGGEILFVTVSVKPFDLSAISAAESILDDSCICEYRYSDEYEDRIDCDRYFICYKTGIVVPGRDLRSQDADTVMTKIAEKYNFNYTSWFKDGYVVFEMTTKMMFTKEIGDEIKEALEKVYPGKFVFENPTLR